MRNSFVLLCVLALAGCSKAGIGVKSDVKSQSFVVGTTNRTQVVNEIGLPQAVEKDAEGNEHFFYETSTRLAGMCLGCGTPNSTAGLIPAMAVESSKSRTRANAVELVFNPAGVLMSARGPKPTQRNDK